MNNELRILPLRKYDVSYVIQVDTNDIQKEDTFTADQHNVVMDGPIVRNLFYRTGNVIREYQLPLNRVVATPVDEDPA